MKLTDLLNRNVQLRPNEQAICFEGKPQTYASLNQRVTACAGALRQLGVENGERVAMLSMNSPEFIEYLLAVPWAGGVLNPINIRWSSEEIAYSLTDSGTRILLVDKHFEHLLEEIQAKTPGLDTVIYVGDGPAPQHLLRYEQLLTNAEPLGDAGRKNDDLLGIFYTGGTTGFPKGVMLSHDNLVSSATEFAACADIPRQPRSILTAPMFHMGGLMALLMTFVKGGCVVVVPAFEPAAVIDAIDSQKITDAFFVPTMIQTLVDSPVFDPDRISSLQRIVFGASPMPAALVSRLSEVLPHVGLIQGYGMTETAGFTAGSPAENHSPDALASGRFRAAGLTAFLTEVSIVNGSGEEAASGEVGEIVVRGDNVMQGYWGKPDLTQETIIDGWMHTVDAGYIDEGGWLYIVDRVKDMVISGGENIYSAEVENALAQHPDIASCAVIGIPSEQWGETVHAAIVPVPGESLSLEEVREFCRERIAAYKAPRSIALVDALPLSGAGKVLKSELRQPFWEGNDHGVA